MIPFAHLVQPQCYVAMQQRYCVWDVASFGSIGEVKVFVNLEQPSIQVAGLISIISYGLLNLNSHPHPFQL